MFTGIIEDIGIVSALKKTGAHLTLTITTGLKNHGILAGDSIAVNGVCLTAAHTGPVNQLAFNVMPKTLELSNLSQVRSGDRVHLERAMVFGGRVDGHFVTGHIDTAARIIRQKKSTGAVVCTIELPASYRHLVTPQGSIAVDGISLTVADKQRGSFSVSLVDFTRRHTTLADKRPGNIVNLEFDIIAKYIQEQKTVIPKHL